MGIEADLAQVRDPSSQSGLQLRPNVGCQDHHVIGAGVGLDHDLPGSGLGDQQTVGRRAGGDHAPHPRGQFGVSHLQIMAKRGRTMPGWCRPWSTLRLGLTL